MGNQAGLSIRDLSFLPWSLRVLDGLVFIALGFAMYMIYVGELPLPRIYKEAFIVGFLLCQIVFPMFGIYNSWRGKRLFEQAHILLVACATVFMSLILISVALKTTIQYSRIWMGLWVIFGSLGIVFYRELVFALLRQLRRHGINQKNIMIIGNTEFNARITERLTEADWTGYKLAKHCDELDIAAFTEEEFIQCLKENDIVEVWVTYSLRDAHRINDLLKMTKNYPIVKFRYIPDISDFQLLLNNSVSEIAGIVTMELNHSPVEGINSIVKDIEDRVLGAIILVLISPILLFTAIAIKLDSKGPILFKQKRHGWGGKTINVYKFRTMRMDACEGEFEQATKDDPRVTRLGKFLRKTSIDELPQFYNVLQGRMSIVGPRPHPEKLNFQYMEQMDHYFTRNKVKPGITGWAQVNGWRGETDTIEKMEKRVEHDLYYIRNWSLWLDIKIIFLTIFRGFTGRNAY